ncbi:MAG: sigma-70 family RNA polymerase sigma factor [Planctomycetota bacterium]
MNDRADALDADRLLAHAAWLRALAQSLARGADADDLAQETWRIALERRPASLDDSRLRGWLATVARRLALRVRRDAAADRAHEERWVIESNAIERRARERGDPGVDDACERSLLHKRIADAVHELDEPYRSAVVLRYFDGLDARAIAVRQGVSHDAARQRLSRALALLRARLDHEYGGRRAQWAALAWVGLDDGADAAPWITGGALMGGKLAVAVVVVVGVVAWWCWSSRGARLVDPATAAAPAELGGEIASPTAMEPPSALAERAPAAAAELVASGALERVIDRERDLHGVVLDTDRQPIAGARVIIVHHASAEFAFLDLDREHRAASRVRIAEQATDDAGEFVIPLEAGRSYDLVVEAPGFAPGGASHCHAGERVEVVLTEGATLSGRVLRQRDDSPVVGAKVELHYARNLDAQQTADTVQVETDSEGRYRFDALPPGERMFGAFPRADARSGWIVVTLAPGRSIEQDIRVESGWTLRGRVVDRDTRAPIADAVVGEGWTMRRTVRTDARGEFEFQGFTIVDPYEIAVRAPGYGRNDLELRAPSPDADEPIEVALTRGRTLRGRIVDRNGAPIDDAYVAATAFEFFGIGPAQQHDWQATRSRADGTYEIEEVRRDLHHLLFVKKAGYGTVSYDLDDLDNAADVLAVPDVVLQAGAIVRGVVADEDGEPYASRVVHLYGRNRDGTIWNDRDRSLAIGHVAERSTRTDDLGRFAFADVANGNYELSAPLRNVEVGVRKQVAVDDATPVVETELILPRGLSIIGRVVGPDGKGVLAFLVLDSPDDPRGLVRQYTEHDGTFELRGLVSGVYSGFAYPTYLESVAASARLANGELREIAAGRTDVVVRLDRAVALRGRVIDADGAAAAGVNLEALREGVVETIALTAADGTFVLWVAENGGPYVLRATSRAREDGEVQRVETFAPEHLPFVSNVTPGDGREHVIRLP